MRGGELRPNDGVALAVLPSGDTYADCLCTNSGIVLAVLESIGSCFKIHFVASWIRLTLVGSLRIIDLAVF